MLPHFKISHAFFLIGNFPSAEENFWNDFVPSVNLKFAEFTRLTKETMTLQIHSEASNSSSHFFISLVSVTISHAHFTALSGSEIQETYFSGLQEVIIPGYLCSSEVTLPQLPISPAGLEVRLALASPFKHQAPGASSSPSCLHSHTQEFFSESTLLLSVLSGNRNVCDYVWRKLLLGE